MAKYAEKGIPSTLCVAIHQRFVDLQSGAPYATGKVITILACRDRSFSTGLPFSPGVTSCRGPGQFVMDPVLSRKNCTAVTPD